MRDPMPQSVRLEDYTPPQFLIDSIELDFNIEEESTTVRARLAMRRNVAARDASPSGSSAPCALAGEDLALVSATIDGRALASDEYSLDERKLSIHQVPDNFLLETVCRIEPRKNTQLSGMYASKDGFFTQCEAEGFRRITWYLDRPDVMSRFSVTLRADREKYPNLLSNGNLIESGIDAENSSRHWTRWVDPFVKPAYLFALVAAKLDVLEDTFVTHSGRSKRLAVYVEPGKLDQCGFAMQALKKAMKWDEDAFGLELDLDQYMIVAVGDFNMGAMENKGLNIFNTKFVLARPDTATDTDYMNIDRVVAHEYFHNWTGNRVTCRDWFQLSLKEGLTVFRDQEFGADMYSRPVQRIQEVRTLRGAQFPEDAGPMAHPVRPSSYVEISNFYTATVYEKGAAVVRMMHTLIGAGNFRKGMDLYFARHDGQAVTCDDFAQAMADASGTDLTQFRRWYSQAGTPVIEARGDYNEGARTFTLSLDQSCPPTQYELSQKDATPKQAYHIPFALGLISPRGAEMPLRLEGEAAAREGEANAASGHRVISVKYSSERFVFVNVAERPVPSLLRDFSAPVILRYDYSEADLAHLMAHDTDSFNRWEAGQRLAVGVLVRNIAAIKRGAMPSVPEALTRAFAKLLDESGDDPAFAAEALTLPSEIYLAEQMEVVDPEAILAARVYLRRALAHAMQEKLLAIYNESASSAPYSPDSKSAGRRALRNLALGYLMELERPDIRQLCVAQFERADNMTDAMAALTTLAQFNCPERAAALDAFIAKWRDEPLVVDKWLMVQSSSRLPGTLAEVKRLCEHPAFDIRNPNKVYALIRAFCANPARFHSANGYAFGAEKVIELDRLNPQVAARIARAFDRWKKFDAGRQTHARAALERIRDASGLSRDVGEIVQRALA
ncbi:MAG: aminopeptidase N [Betaproteobacteria bacterium]|nr:aminopeptidase N [Betaproteobacteria bacterium]